MKAQRNLTPVLANMASSSSISSSCSLSPPPANPCSSSVVTPSANSILGESPPVELGSQDDLDNTPAPTFATPRVHQHHEMSPRTGNQITEPAFSEDEMEFISDENKTEQKVDEYEEKCLPKRTMSQSNGYSHPSKSRINHFLRYSDVREKELPKPTLSNLANQKDALQKLNGWKIYHLRSHMEDMVNSETEYIGRYTSLQSSLEIKQNKCKNKDIERDISRINERIMANHQRSEVVRDQMLEAKLRMMKFFKHKNFIASIIKRNIRKRPVKKRRRT